MRDGLLIGFAVLFVVALFHLYAQVNRLFGYLDIMTGNLLKSMELYNEHVHGTSTGETDVPSNQLHSPREHAGHPGGTKPVGGPGECVP